MQKIGILGSMSLAVGLWMATGHAANCVTSVDGSCFPENPESQEAVAVELDPIRRWFQAIQRQEEADRQAEEEELAKEAARDTASEEAATRRSQQEQERLAIECSAALLDGGWPTQTAGDAQYWVQHGYSCETALRKVLDQYR